VSDQLRSKFANIGSLMYSTEHEVCSLKACRPSAMLPPLACPLCNDENRVHLSLSGLWSYITRWETSFESAPLNGSLGLTGVKSE
jgi:hypothetical protein